jgi:hypothetical protein
MRIRKLKSFRCSAHMTELTRTAYKSQVIVTATAVIMMAGCTIPADQPAIVGVVNNTLGSVVPVYNPPPNTPFQCVWAGDVVTPMSVPGDVNTPLPIATSPVATLGNRRGDWLLIVTRTGEIGWIFDPNRTVSETHPGMTCHVYQDAQGRLVFKSQVAHGML